MDIYLDANATTPVLPQAQAAARAAMADGFGNPSSTHSTGLRARAQMDSVRTCARRVLGAPSGSLVFVSGATEAIQTAVLSALSALLTRRERQREAPACLLYGATEHKAVPEALERWNRLLGLNLPVVAIPVDRTGRHDLAWLRAQAPRAGLVCTMAANNETGVVSDLDGIAAALAGSAALWMVDSVQALGKLPLRLAERPIDYAPFSGHKLYAPKGIGLLYVREGAPFTPLLCGGGQEQAMRAGTENLPGIAALGAVPAALEGGGIFCSAATLAGYRDRLVQALEQALPGLVFNAPLPLCLPTTLNFSVPGVSARQLLDVFDAAGVRLSGGSACSAAQAQPSAVLEAMGLPAWQSSSAVRLSFGPASTAGFIDEACERIRACGSALRDSGLVAGPALAAPVDGVIRHGVDGACCYLVADAGTRSCVVVDPLPSLTGHLSQWVRCRGYTLRAVLATHGGNAAMAAATQLRAALPAPPDTPAPGPLGWPHGAAHVALGRLRLTRLALPGAAGDEAAYVLHDERGVRLGFVGNAVMPGASDGGSARSEPPAPVAWRRRLEQAIGPHTLLAPARDHDHRFATTLRLEGMVQPRAAAPHPSEPVELPPQALAPLLAAHPALRLVDVREPCEQRVGAAPEVGTPVQHVPLSMLLGELPAWLALPADTPLVFFCRSGNRSAQAARAVRRLGHERAWSLGGGLALWPGRTGGAIA